MAESSRLLQVIAKSHDSITITHFTYDTDGKLVSISDSDNNYHVNKTLFEYNAEGKLIATKEFPDHAATPNSTFYFYENGLLSKKITSYGQKNTYAYDAQHRLIADTLYSYSIPNEIEAYTVFSYTNDDITSWQYFISYAGSFISSPIIHATFSNSLNPYNAIGLNYYVSRLELEALSKHLITQIDYPTGIANYSYEYYSNGLVKKVTIDYTNSWAEETTIEFFYQ